MIASGDRFGRWTVLSIGESTKDKKIRFRCECDCGEVRNVREYYLLKGRSRSCGCLSRDVASNRATHGKSETREYKIWRAMKGRCLNETHSSYAHYGSRGIAICDRWVDSFENFLADMGPSPDGYTIERIDVDGDYSPENCVWASRQEQSRNRRPMTDSGIVGVTRQGNGWRAQIVTNGVKRHIKTCKDFFEACCARRSAEIKYWGESRG